MLRKDCVVMLAMLVILVLNLFNLNNPPDWEIDTYPLCI